MFPIVYHKKAMHGWFFSQKQSYCLFIKNVLFPLHKNYYGKKFLQIICNIIQLF